MTINTQLIQALQQAEFRRATAKQAGGANLIKGMVTGAAGAAGAQLPKYRSFNNAFRLPPVGRLTKDFAAPKGNAAQGTFSLPPVGDLIKAPAVTKGNAAQSINPGMPDPRMAYPAPKANAAAQPINPINPGTPNPAAFSVYAANNPARPIGGGSGAGAGPIGGGSGAGAGPIGGGSGAAPAGGGAAATPAPPPAGGGAAATPAPPPVGGSGGRGAVAAATGGAVLGAGGMGMLSGNKTPAAKAPVAAPDAAPGAAPQGNKAPAGPPQAPPVRPPEMMDQAFDFVHGFLPKAIGDPLRALQQAHGSNATVGGVSVGLIGLLLLLQQLTGFGKSGAVVPWRPQRTAPKRLPTGRFLAANGETAVSTTPEGTVAPAPLAGEPRQKAT